LSKYRVSKFLPGRSRLAAYLTRRIHRVLCLDGFQNVRHSDSELRQPVRINPEPHRVLSRAKDLRLPDTGQARERIAEVDVGVVRQELRVVRALWRIQTDEHEWRRHRF